MLTKFNSNNDSEIKVSVIVPTYNRSRLLSFTLDSLVRQEMEKNEFEVIVSDDGSSDDTKEVLKKYESLVDIKYVYQRDLGYRVASARNNAILLSTGEICLFIDSGILLRENCIREHINFHFESERHRAAIGYIYGYSRDREVQLKLESLLELSSLGETIDRLCEMSIFFDKRNSHYEKYGDRIQDLPAPWHYFWGGHVSVRRENLMQIGMFDTSYDGRWGIEDNDLGFRLHASGVELALLRSAQVIHYPHGDKSGDDKKQGYLNCIDFNQKYDTTETRLFLEHFKSNKLEDINDIALKSRIAAGNEV